MDDTNELISVWKSKQRINNIEENKEFFKSNKHVMNTIIAFETREKLEKNKQIYAVFVFFGLTAYLLYNTPISSSTLIGLALVGLAMAFGIISNRTNNFPDIKQLNTKDYLISYKNNTLKRNKMHVINSIIGSCIALPGLYLAFKDAFPELGFLWMPIMFTSASVATFLWFKEYRKRSGLVLEEVSEMIEEFE